MESLPEGVGEHGELVPGPPWILGHRGAPREAPENTLASLRRALDLGLDGVEYDLRAAATGEAVLIHDDTLERTTDHAGPVSMLSLPELAAVDAGGWFQKSFAGEPLPLLEEALELPGRRPDAPPMHMIEVKDAVLVPEVARRVAELGRGLSVRVASFDRRACVEARDLGLEAMLLALEADEEDRRFVRDERLAAYGTGPGGWRTEAGRLEWACERWSWSVDDPDDLLEACRLPLLGFNTDEPRRALAVRALVRLAPADQGAYPIRVPDLEVAARPEPTGLHGEWAGRWSLAARVRNPLPWPVVAGAAPYVRGGAFEVEGLPTAFELDPGEERELAFELAGGSWSPGDDPALVVRLGWRGGPGRPGGAKGGGLVLDAPLRRVRRAFVRRDAVRLWMLRERPGDRRATMTLRRRGRELLLRVEDDGGTEDVRAIVRLGLEVRRGGRGARVLLPPDFDARPEGIAFSCGFEGRADGGPRRLFRWAGGVPEGLRAGSPGRLLPGARG